jgi:hypothetical protein
MVVGDVGQKFGEQRMWVEYSLYTWMKYQC